MTRNRGYDKDDYCSYNHQVVNNLQPLVKDLLAILQYLYSLALPLKTFLWQWVFIQHPSAPPPLRCSTIEMSWRRGREGWLKMWRLPDSSCPTTNRHWLAYKRILSMALFSARARLNQDLLPTRRPMQ